MRNFVLITNIYKDRELRLSHRIVSYIQDRGGRAGICVSNIEGVMQKDFELSEIPKDTECIIVLGGDGTLIRAATKVESLHIPLIGVNLGTLGYLCELEETTVFEAVDRLMADNYMIEERLMLSGGKTGETPQLALNDVVIHWTGDMSMLQLHVTVNGKFLTTYHADGIIVATPTGSTGYNMSAGGPIVEPGARLMVMTPICPHTLNTRSIILSPEDQVEIVIAEGRDGQAQQAEVNFDGGQAQMLTTGDRIRVHQSEQVVRLLHINKVSFLQMLHKKMGEG